MSETTNQSEAEKCEGCGVALREGVYSVDSKGAHLCPKCDIKAVHAELEAQMRIPSIEVGDEQQKTIEKLETEIHCLVLHHKQQQKTVDALRAEIAQGLEANKRAKELIGSQAEENDRVLKTTEFSLTKERKARQEAEAKLCELRDIMGLVRVYLHCPKCTQEYHCFKCSKLRDNLERILSSKADYVPRSEVEDIKKKLAVASKYIETRQAVLDMMHELSNGSIHRVERVKLFNELVAQEESSLAEFDRLSSSEAKGEEV